MKKDKVLSTLFVISRWFVGIVFLFSSFSKGVDPMGTSYKIQEYMTAWSIGSLSFEWALPLATFLSISMIALEFLTGMLLITNCCRKLSAWVLMLLMTFFTVTTLIDAITNKVTDCGCFGDMIKLTNWETFWKNVVLMIFTVCIFICRNMPKKKKTFERDILVFVFSIAIIVAFQLYNIANEPILDFRSWKIGNRMMPEEKGEVKSYLIYKNKQTGEQQEITSEQLMEYYQDINWQNTWEFVDSKIVDPNEIYADGFSMMSVDGVDYAKEIISSEEPIFIITIHHLDKVGKKGINKIQHVYNYVKDKGINTMLLVSISYTPEEVEAFIEANIPDGIEYYYADEKAIETMLRSNPGFILLKESVVLGKWHYNNSGDILNMSTEDIQDLDIMINKNKSSEQ